MSSNAFERITEKSKNSEAEEDDEDNDKTSEACMIRSNSMMTILMILSMLKILF